MKKLLVTLILIMTMVFSATAVYATSDSSVVIVNPVSRSTVYSNNLLISVKITKPQTIKVTVYEEQQMVNGTLSAVNINRLVTSNGTVTKASFTPRQIGQPEFFTSNNDLSFYIKQVNGVTPGLYRVRVDVVDGAGKELSTIESHVAVKEKPAEAADAKLFESPQSGTLQLLQNILKTIFGN